MKLTFAGPCLKPERESFCVGELAEVIDLGEVLEVGVNHRRFGLLFSGVLFENPFGQLVFLAPPPFQLIAQEVEPGEFVEVGLGHPTTENQSRP